MPIVTLVEVDVKGHEFVVHMINSMHNMLIDTLKSMDQWLVGQKPEHAIHPLNSIYDLPSI